MCGRGHGLGPGGGKAVREFVDEQQIRAFGVAVGGPATVAPLAVQIVEVDVARPVLLDTLITRAPGVASSRGSRSPVSAKCPR